MATIGGVITTGAHPKALWPGIKTWWGRQYAEHMQEYPEWFDVETSDKAYEEDVEISGFGVLREKDQGAALNYDTEVQGSITRYTHIAYAGGYIVTFEELRDNLYEVVSKRRAAMLAFAGRQTEEIIGANVFNQAFNTSYPIGDGAAAISASHPIDRRQSVEPADHVRGPLGDGDRRPLDPDHAGVGLPRQQDRAGSPMPSASRRRTGSMPIASCILSCRTTRRTTRSTCSRRPACSRRGSWSTTTSRRQRRGLSAPTALTGRGSCGEIGRSLTLIMNLIPRTLRRPNICDFRQGSPILAILWDAGRMSGQDS